MPPMPTPRAGAAVAVLGKQILVVGGVGEDQSPLKVVEIYNTEEGRWRKRSSLREALMGVSITVKGTVLSRTSSSATRFDISSTVSPSTDSSCLRERENVDVSKLPRNEL